jgi:hypothetical protein
MSKRHFIALADTLRDLKPRPMEAIATDREQSASLARMAQWIETCAAMAAFCRAQNGNLNTQRWLEYIDGTCGPNGGKVATK